MKQFKETGIICLKDELGIEHALCELTYILNEDETFKYIFKPNYSTISLLKPGLFFGIPGLNLDLKREEYIRDNYKPCFITERVPQENREDLYEMLDEVGLDYLDPIEYLIRVKTRYSGDKLYMIRPFDHSTVELENVISTQNIGGIIRVILDELAHGNNIKLDNILIDDSNRKIVFDTLKFLYKKSINANKEKQIRGVEKAKQNGVYKGRLPIEINIEQYLKMLNEIEAKNITVTDACKVLNISRDKFYRLKKSLNK